MFRSADVFGVSKIYLCGYTGAPPRQEISKVALGAEKWMQWEVSPRTHSIVERLRAQGYHIVALETGALATSIINTDFPSRVAMVVGNEVTGITTPILRRADVIVQIPLYGKKESLNVAVACGIGLSIIRHASL